MKRLTILGLALLTSSSLATLLQAAELPPIKVTDSNKVPECATPGRLMAFIATNNSSIDPRFEKIAVDYMREGEELGVRWDYAFAQMAIETSYLTYKRAGGKMGDVKPAQNNFAGLGATGRGEPGESFKDVATGVRAHLQHLLMYAGDPVENPAADRTRKVQEWGVLKSFHARIKGPVTFGHLAQKWAVASDYGVAIQSHTDKFYADHCKSADPKPELVAQARGDGSKRTAVVVAEVAVGEVQREKVSGADLARRAIEDARAEGDGRRRGLGAKKLAKPIEIEAAEPDPKPATGVPSFTVLNAPRPEVKPEVKAEKAVPAQPVEKTQPIENVRQPEKTARVEKPKVEKPQFLTASAAGSMAKPIPPVAAGTKCRVWTASYGGQKAVIIRAQIDGAVNFTVLDVNEGAERREAEAYIQAYAKGGEIAAEFQSQTLALDKAFELCPEG